MKIRLNLKLSVFIFFLIQIINGQERDLLQGKVVVDSLRNLEGIHVINLSAEIGTTTANDGSYKILATTGDTLFFSSIVFEHQKVIVKKESLDTILIVYLKKKYNELPEVQLDDIRLTGDIAKDIDLVPKSVYEKLGMSFPRPRRTSLELETHSAYNGGNIVTLLNKLNGKFRRLKTAEVNNNLYDRVNKGLNLLGKDFFINQLNIKEEQIYNFLFYCARDSLYSELVHSNNILQLIVFFEIKIDSFKELRGLD